MSLYATITNLRIMPFIHHRPSHIEGCIQSPEPSSCYICPLLVECRVFFDEFEHMSPEELANLISERINQQQLGHSDNFHRQPPRSNIVYMFEAEYPPKNGHTDLAFIFTRNEINNLLARRKQIQVKKI